jgi:isoleucyl-tRNA synthetase
VIGPKFGKMVNAVAKRIKEMTSAEVTQLEKNDSFTFDVNGTTVVVAKEDVTVTAQSIEGWLVDSDAGLTVALDTKLSPELVSEGLAREFVNRVQNMRKDAGLSVTDRIRIQFESTERIQSAIVRLSGYIKSETLASDVASGRSDAGHWTKWDIDGEPCEIGIAKV